MLRNSIIFGSLFSLLLSGGLSADECTLPDGIQKFYETGVEKERLAKDAGLIEKLRTEKILSQFLPKAPAVIYDVGGGMGAYSFDLAEKGYTVYLIDPVAFNIDEAKKIGETRKNASLKGYIVGDARKIAMPDKSADVVLFFGPLYHLNKADREVALKEALRVLKPGGMLFAAGISKFAPLAGALMKGGRANLDTTDNLDKGRFVFRGGTFYSHYPQELREEVENAGFQNVSVRAIEGFGSFVNKEILANDELRQKILAAVEQIEQEPSLLGATSHLMAIGVKP